MSIEAAFALPPGHILGAKYRVVSVLGHGGFGITYKAEHVDLPRLFAIKEYLPNEFAMRHGTTVSAKSSADEETYQWGIDSFLREAQLLSGITHNNVITAYDFFRENNTAYLVMPYEDGEPLDRLLKARGSLNSQQLIRLLLPIAEAVEHIHTAEVTHRDIKPANIFIRRRDESPVLLDFGAARQALGQRTKSVTALASAGYSPPEQYYTDGEQGPWTDIYALSAVAYECVTGEKPVEAPKRANAMLRGSPDPQPRLEEDADAVAAFGTPLLAAIDEGLNVIEAARPQNIAAWLARINDEDLPPPPPPPEPPPGPGPDADDAAEPDGDQTGRGGAVLQRPPKRNRWLRTALGVLIPPLLAAIGVAIWLDGKVTDGLLARNGTAPSFVWREDSNTFRIMPRESGYLTIESVGGVDVEASLYDSTGALLESDDDSGQGRNFRIRVPVADAMHRLVVRGVAGDWGTHTLVTRFEAAPSLTTLELGATSGHTLFPGHTSEFDLPVTDAGRLRIESSGGLDVVGTLFDGDRTQLAENDDSGQSLNFAIELDVEPGTHRLHVDGINDSTTGPFELTTRFAQHQPFTIVARPSSARVRILDIPPTYRDGMRLPAGTYRVEVSAQGFDTIVRNVNHGSGSATRVTIDLAASDDHGDTPGEATAASFGRTVSGSLRAGDRDVFSYRIPGRGAFVINSTGSTDTHGRLLARDGRLFFEDADRGDGNNFRLSGNTQSATTVYVEVSGEQNTTRGDYRLESRFTPSDDHGDRPQDATDMTLGRRVTGDLTAGDSDYFEFEVTTMGQLRLQSDAGLDVKASLYHADATGTALISNDDGGPGRNFLLQPTLLPGRYILKVQAFSSQGSGNYAVDSSFTSSSLHGGTAERATIVRLGRSIPPGRTTSSLPFNHFRFLVTSQRQVTLQSSGSSDVVGTLRDARGNDVERNDDGGSATNFRIQRTLSPGVYVLQVERYGSNTNSNYSLTIQ